MNIICLLGASLSILTAFHQGNCEYASIFRHRRSPEDNFAQNVANQEANQVNSVLDHTLQTPEEFHKVGPKDVTFDLTTRENRTAIPLNETNLGLVKNKLTVIVAGGWFHNTSSPSSYFVNITEAYLAKGDYNIIQVHADMLLFYPEEVSATYTDPIGSRLGNLILYLNSRSGLSLHNIHIIGHGMGGHIGGAAGRRVLRQLGKKIQRITALEISSLGFTNASPTQRLDRNDAVIVDVIHTAAGQVGLNKSIGTADFWPNGGTAPQPGCPLYPPTPATNFDELGSIAYCSHDRSLWYFIYTINSTSSVRARKCSSYERFVNGRCSFNQAVVFGDNYSGKIKGNFYLQLSCIGSNCSSAF